MRISEFRLKNYKSFIDSREISFSPGFNIFIGKNNAGKTALLEALGLQFTAKPHRSLRTKPQKITNLNPVSSAEVELVVSGKEVQDILLSSGLPFNFPVSRLFARGPLEEQQRKAITFLKEFLGMDEIHFQMGLLSQSLSGIADFQVTRFPAHGLFHGKSDKNFYAIFDLNPDKTVFIYSKTSEGSENSNFEIPLINRLRERIYSFKAERLNVSTCLYGENPMLAQNASNLAEVLNVLKSKNPSRFNRFNELIREIFPFIYQISVVPAYQNMLQIMVWLDDPKSERDDLPIELSESGTGIGQVLAILYVVINSEFPRTIIIDEPNSFLHPGAARKLLEILSTQFSMHQYIISTHSPEIIRAAISSNLLLIKWENNESRLERLDSSQIRDAQKCLIEVGSKLSDVFGADKILWVEGPTEEECFPRILMRAKHYPPLGYSIISVKNTGDFQGKQKKHKELILEIYRKLSITNALIPPAVGFVFDSEDLSECDKEDLRRESNQLVHFLPRRMFENYLLDPEAIATVMKQLNPTSNAPITASQIQDYIELNGGKKEYLDPPRQTIKITEPEWLKNVNAAKLLMDLFAVHTPDAESYRKTKHSVAITDWLLENRPVAFGELTSFLIKIMG